MPSISSTNKNYQTKTKHTTVENYLAQNINNKKTTNWKNNSNDTNDGNNTVTTAVSTMSSNPNSDLIKFINSDPSNKLCADCRTPIPEPSRSYASYHAESRLGNHLSSLLLDDKDGDSDDVGSCQGGDHGSPTTSVVPANTKSDSSLTKFAPLYTSAASSSLGKDSTSNSPSSGYDKDVLNTTQSPLNISMSSSLPPPIPPERLSGRDNGAASLMDHRHIDISSEKGNNKKHRKHSSKKDEVVPLAPQPSAKQMKKINKLLAKSITKEQLQQLKENECVGYSTAVRVVDFKSAHLAFAPPTAQLSNTGTRLGKSSLSISGGTPIRSPFRSRKQLMLASHGDSAGYNKSSRNNSPNSIHVGRHGVFICQSCSLVHSALGEKITCVKSVKNGNWTRVEVALIKLLGGNARARHVLEQYLPLNWKARIPNHTSSMAEREMFCRAKYEALAFMLPSNHMLDVESQWTRLIESGGNNGTLQSMSSASFQQSSSSELSSTKLPSRLVDFLCVVEPTTIAATHFYSQTTPQDLKKATSPAAIELNASVVHTYPEQHVNADTTVPSHLATFVFPNGCRPSIEERSPHSFSFVLTLEDGSRLYGAALHLFENATSINDLLGMEQEKLPPQKMTKFLNRQASSFIDPSTVNEDGYQLSLVNYPDTIYLPKCICLLSHYPFHDVYRQFLQYLYRISLVEAPIPIERYIANFIREIPLPPLGRVEINYCLTKEVRLLISRPPKNRLPLLNMSYRPLFTTLSVGNIMVVFGCLLQETRVAICSKHTALLTAVTESFLSLLFPFVWQGCYIPVMPQNMLDILDAPVPFLVGLHSKYLQNYKPQHRPNGVVFVDVDHDIVHLGFEDDAMTSYARGTPLLPEKAATKLKVNLDKFGGMAYLSPTFGVGNAGSGGRKKKIETNYNEKKGRVTCGNEEPLDNGFRESYAHESHINSSSGGSSNTSGHYHVGGKKLQNLQTIRQQQQRSRDVVLADLDKAFPNEEHFSPIRGFATDRGTLLGRKDDSVNTSKQRGSEWNIRGMRLRKKKNKKSATLSSIMKRDLVNGNDDLSVLSDKMEFNNQNNNDAASVASSVATTTTIMSSPNPSLLDDNIIKSTNLPSSSFNDHFNIDEIRNAFLRFFVSVLRNYDKFVNSKALETHNEDLFNTDEFLQHSSSDHLNSRCHEWLRGLCSSQMFQIFLEEHVQNPDQPEIRFFREAIIAKQNRSVSVSIKNRGRKDTPFLSDKTDAITEAFQPPPPSNWGLPDDGSTYHYGSFPSLKKNLFGNVRLQKQKWETQQDQELQRKILNVPNMLQSKSCVANNLFVNSVSNGTKTPERDLFWALHVIAYKNQELLGNNSNTTLAGASAEFGKSSARNRQNNGMDEDKLRIMNKVGTSTLARSMIPSALSIISSCRRKQARQIYLIVISQATFRMVHLRGHYTAMKCGAFRIQNVWRLRRFNKNYGTKYTRLYVKARNIQCMFRSKVARIRADQRRIAIVTLQSHIRGINARVYIRALRESAVFVQSRTRGRKARFAFRLLVRELVSLLQGCVRGWLTRLFVKRMKHKRLLLYRTQLFELWRRAYTPLAYRSKFWLQIHGSGFLHLSLHEDELMKMWQELGLNEIEYKSIIVGPENREGISGKLGRKSMAVHQTFCIVQRKINSVSPDKNESILTSLTNPSITTTPITFTTTTSNNDRSNNNVVKKKNKKTSSTPSNAKDHYKLVPIFPAEVGSPISSSSKSARVQRRMETLLEYRHQEGIERSEIYEKLKFATSTEVLNEFLTSFLLRYQKKRKKQSLVEMLWQDISLSKESALVVLYDEQETQNNSNIHSGSNQQKSSGGSTFTPKHKISKRARKIFGSSTKDGHVSGFLRHYATKFTQERVEKRIRMDMISTVRACMISIQNLHNKGPSSPDEAEMRHERQMDAYGLGGRHLDEEAFRDIRAVIIGRYLSCDNRSRSVYYSRALQRDQLKRLSRESDASVHSEITTKVKNASKKPRRRRTKTKTTTSLSTVSESRFVSIVGDNQQKGLMLRKQKPLNEQTNLNNDRKSNNHSRERSGNESRSSSEVMTLTNHVAEMSARHLFAEMTKEC